jgi:hypothetical protein
MFQAFVSILFALSALLAIFAIAGTLRAHGFQARRAFDTLLRLDRGRDFARTFQPGSIQPSASCVGAAAKGRAALLSLR